MNHRKLRIEDVNFGDITKRANAWIERELTAMDFDPNVEEQFHSLMSSRAEVTAFYRALAHMALVAREDKRVFKTLISASHYVVAAHLAEMDANGQNQKS